MVLRAWAEDIRAPIGDVRNALRRVRNDPSAASDADWAELLGAAGDELDELCDLADAARVSAVGADALTFVVNRNFDTATVAALGRSGVTLEDLVTEAHDLGATEICMQGPLPAAAPADGYLRLVDTITATAPDLHLHAFRPAEVRDGAARMGIGLDEYLARLRDAGLGSVPGTAAQILDDDVRRALAGNAPVLTVAEWVETIEAAHRAGMFSTATMLYGHVETPRQQVAHLRTLNGIAERTHGFHELILMPMLPVNAGPHLASIAVAAPGERETRAVHAVARLMTLGHIDHLQVAWTKLDAPVVDRLLRGGADDIGGLLLDGQLMPDAGPEAGRVLTAEGLTAIAERAGRTLRQRTTGYGEPAADRQTVLGGVSR
ncbi:FO synthase [Gordonia sp. NPDC003585]|uniref:FO synthase n=1 Tax=unclassified Gordonia (in: high G+C Gram-positive bacteria) TaxID=2657482 RepID=UPI0033A0DDDA